MTPTHEKSTKPNLPAAVARTGKRQLSVSLSDELCAALERIRIARGFKSWAAVVCALIDEGDDELYGDGGDKRTCLRLKSCTWPFRATCKCAGRQR